MRLTQAAIIAVLAFTVAANPIQVRSDVESTPEYKAAPETKYPVDDKKDSPPPAPQPGYPTHEPTPDPKKCYDAYGKEVKCGAEVPKYPTEDSKFNHAFKLLSAYQRVGAEKKCYDSYGKEMKCEDKDVPKPPTDDSKSQ